MLFDYVLSAILFVAAAAKGLAGFRVSKERQEEQPMPPIRSLLPAKAAPAIAVFEVLTATGLLFRRSRTVFQLTAAGFFAVGYAAFYRIIWRKEVRSCDCFGQSDDHAIGASHLLRNSMLLSAAASGLIADRQAAGSAAGQLGRLPIRLVSFLALEAITLVPAFLLVAKRGSLGQKEAEREEKYSLLSGADVPQAHLKIGKRSKVDIRQVVGEIAQGESVDIVFGSPDCQSCLSLRRRLEEQSRLQRPVVWIWRDSGRALNGHSALGKRIIDAADNTGAVGSAFGISGYPTLVAVTAQMLVNGPYFVGVDAVCGSLSIDVDDLALGVRG